MRALAAEPMNEPGTSSTAGPRSPLEVSSSVPGALAPRRETQIIVVDYDQYCPPVVKPKASSIAPVALPAAGARAGPNQPATRGRMTPPKRPNALDFALVDDSREKRIALRATYDAPAARRFQRTPRSPDANVTMTRSFVPKRENLLRRRSVGQRSAVAHQKYTQYAEVSQKLCTTEPHAVKATIC